jgi:aspartate/methionine/tyrosine aminotransferase
MARPPDPGAPRPRPLSLRIPADLTPNRIAIAVEARRAAGDDILDLTLSNPTRAGFTYPPDLLAPLADPRALTYSPEPFGMPDARRAVAADYARRGVRVTPDRIALTASTSEAYSLLFKTLCDPGDEVLVPRPSYPLFDHLTRLDAVAPIAYDLDSDRGWAIDFASVERAITARTRAVLIVSPNNPTGSFVDDHDLALLVSLCARRNLVLIADEVFADFELTAGAARRAGQPLHVPDVVVFSLGGCSKSIGLPQVKLGWIAAAGPESRLQPIWAGLEIACDAYLSAGTPVQSAAGTLLSQGAVVREQIRARLIENYRHLDAAIRQVPSCRLLPSQGGWSSVLQVPSFEPEEDLVLGLLTRDGVLVHPGFFFDFERPSFLVVSLLVEGTQLAEGISRILRHFDCNT